MAGTVGRSISHNWSEEALKLLRRLNNFSEPTSSKKSCIPFIVCGENVGILQPEVVASLKEYPETFQVVEDGTKPIKVELNPDLKTYDSRSNAVMEVVKDLRKKDAFETLRGWRNEDYDVASGPNETALLKVERVATSLFGVRAYGAHLNGYVRHPQKGVCLWLAQRSLTKPTFPGMLDNLAAGGMGVGLGIRETMMKEVYEEASVPEHIAKSMIPVGCISYIYEDSRGICVELQYCFDLELPLDFIPKPLDGEVQKFMLCDMDEVKRMIIQDDFKPNCAAITLHFLVRHGFITPDNEPKYTEIVQRMNNWY